MTARRGATAVLSVGLAPGVTNLLARHISEISGKSPLRIGVQLGLGEQHGPAALAWTLDGIVEGGGGGSWEMGFPGGVRRVHRFPFSDQVTLPGTLGAGGVVTGLCLDSRVVTRLLGAAGKPAVARFLRRPRVRDAVLGLLSRAHFGSDAFAVTVEDDARRVRASFSGAGQGRATGLVAAEVVRMLPSFPAGVHHLEELVDPLDFLGKLDGGTVTVEGGATLPGRSLRV